MKAHKPVTELLLALQDGDRAVLDELVPLIYDEPLEEAVDLPVGEADWALLRAWLKRELEEIQ